MIRRLLAVLVVVLSLGFSFTSSARADGELDFYVMDLMNVNRDVIVQSWSPLVYHGKLDPDSAWFATLNWVNTSADNTCDVLAIPAGANFIIWNSIIQSGSYYTLDLNAYPFAGVATNDMQIRTCWGFFTRKQIPSDYLAFLSDSNSIITVQDVQSACGQTCVPQTQIDQPASWAIRAMPYASTPDACPSWQLDAYTSAVFAVWENGQLVWRVGKATTFDHPLQPNSCAVIWFFREPQTQQGQIA